MNAQQPIPRIPHPRHIFDRDQWAAAAGIEVSTETTVTNGRIEILVNWTGTEEQHRAIGTLRPNQRAPIRSVHNSMPYADDQGCYGDLFADDDGRFTFAYMSPAASAFEDIAGNTQHCRYFESPDWSRRHESWYGPEPEILRRFTSRAEWSWKRPVFCWRDKDNREWKLIRYPNDMAFLFCAWWELERREEPSPPSRVYQFILIQGGGAERAKSAAALTVINGGRGGAS